MDANCPVKNCTRRSGHDGPHGIELPGFGMVLAPFGDTGRVTILARRTDVPCDRCGESMTLDYRSEGGGGGLSCRCGQRMTLGRDGNSSKVRMTLWGRWAECHGRDRLRFLESKRREYLSYCAACRLLGVAEPDWGEGYLVDIGREESEERAYRRTWRGRLWTILGL